MIQKRIPVRDENRQQVAKPTIAGSGFDVALFGFTRVFLLIASLILAILVAGIVAAMLLVKINVGLDGTGEIRPVTLVPVRTEISGIIEDIRVHDLQLVAKGDTLLVMATDELESALAQSRAVLQSVDFKIDGLLHDHRIAVDRIRREVELKQAEIEGLKLLAEHARSTWEVENRGLLESERSDPYDWKFAQSRLETAKMEMHRAAAETLSLKSIDLQVQQLRMERKKAADICQLAGEQLDRSVVVAPEPGIIIAHEVRLKEREFVNAGAAVLEIGEPNEWMVRCAVSDRNVPFIRVGQMVHIYIEALPYLTHGIFHGKVREISMVPAHASTQNFFTVDVRIDDDRFHELVAEGYAMNGLRASVKYLVERRSIAANIWETVREKGSRFEMARRL